MSAHPFVPRWLVEKNRTRAPAFRDDVDSTVASDPGCAFCAALDAAHEDGFHHIDLDALAREHGECSCLG